jgi:hypothetical protein
MKFEDLPLSWQQHFEIKHPEGRACQQCGTKIPLVRCTFTKHPKQGFCMDRFCQGCMKAYQRARPEQKRSKFAKLRHCVSGSAGPAMEERRPLPCLEVGGKYRIGKEYTGRVIARQGPHYVLETETGRRCFTQGQLIGLEIRREA